MGSSLTRQINEKVTMRIKIVLLIAALIAVPAYSKPSSGGRSHSSRSSHSTTSSHATHSSNSSRPSHTGHSSHSTQHTSRSAPGLARDKHNRIARSAKAKADFKKQQPCPATGRSTGACQGYVIDHVNPLKRGGADSPSNMQWQTKEAAKAKDKIE